MGPTARDHAKAPAAAYNGTDYQATPPLRAAGRMRP